MPKIRARLLIALVICATCGCNHIDARYFCNPRYRQPPGFSSTQQRFLMYQSAPQFGPTPCPPIDAAATSSPQPIR